MAAGVDAKRFPRPVVYAFKGFFALAWHATHHLQLKCAVRQRAHTAAAFQSNTLPNGNEDNPNGKEKKKG